MIGTLSNIGLCLMLIGGAVGSGYLIYSILKLPQVQFLETGLMCLALGLGLLIYGVAGLGFLDLLRPGFIWILVLVSCSAGCWGWMKWCSALIVAADGHGSGRQKKSSTWALETLLGLFLVFPFLMCMTPPMEGDTLHSYLDIPLQYILAGGIVNLPFELHSNIPMNVQMLSAMALALKSDGLAQMLTNGVMVAGVALLIFAMGRRFLTREVGLLAALLFVSMSSVMGLIPSTKVNLGAAFFDLLAVYSVALWFFSEEKK